MVASGSLPMTSCMETTVLSPDWSRTSLAEITSASTPSALLPVAPPTKLLACTALPFSAMAWAELVTFARVEQLMMLPRCTLPAMPPAIASASLPTPFAVAVTEPYACALEIAPPAILPTMFPAVTDADFPVIATALTSAEVRTLAMRPPSRSSPTKLAIFTLLPTLQPSLLSPPSRSRLRRSPSLTPSSATWLGSFSSGVMLRLVILCPRPSSLPVNGLSSVPIGVKTLPSATPTSAAMA